MAIPIQLFQSLRKFIRMLGIHPSQPNQRYSFSLKSVAIFMTLILLFASSTAYFLFKAETIPEYAQCFYMSATALCITINFLTLCLEMRNILKLIEKYEEFIQKGEIFDIRSFILLN